MITRIAFLIAIAGLAVIFFGMQDNVTFLIALGIGLMIVGVIGIAMGVNRRKQTGNRIMFFILGMIILIAVIFGLMNEF